GPRGGRAWCPAPGRRRPCRPGPASARAGSVPGVRERRGRTEPWSPGWGSQRSWSGAPLAEGSRNRCPMIAGRQRQVQCQPRTTQGSPNIVLVAVFTPSLQLALGPPELLLLLKGSIGIIGALANTAEGGFMDRLPVTRPAVLLIGFRRVLGDAVLVVGVEQRPLAVAVHLTADAQGTEFLVKP